jgi:hypothetical protein
MNTARAERWDPLILHSGGEPLCLVENTGTPGTNWIFIRFKLPRAPELDGLFA